MIDDPIWPPIVGVILLFAMASTRLFASADAPPSDRPQRVSTIDGLRGYLALGVLFFHGAVYRGYLHDGIWRGPPSRFYTLLGTGGVAVFFMITGYLFWGRLLDEDGRPDWVALYVGRVFRIAPLYLAAVAIMVALVFADAGWRLLVPLPVFMRELAPWFALGLLDPTDLDHHTATLILIAGVTWSLRYEWLFYFALPLLARAARRTGFVLLALLAVTALGFAWVLHGTPAPLAPGDPAYTTLFLLGMVSASANRHGIRLRRHDRLASVAVLALLAVFFARCPIAYAPSALLLLGAAFLLVVSGCTLLGVLTCRGSKRLGDVSYGIYLLQGLVLAVLFRVAPVRTFASGSPVRHWLVILVAGAILVAVATAAHRWVERPGISLGRTLLRRRHTPARPALPGHGPA